MKIKYGTLTEYNYCMQRYAHVIKECDHNAVARFLSENKPFIELHHEIKASGVLDPSDSQTRNIIGEDLYYPATQNGVLFYPTDAKYIRNTIHTDNVYRILPHTPCLAAQHGDYMVEKMIVNYEYFLDNTNPPSGTRCALICLIADLMNFMTATDPGFRHKLSCDRPFIERWFEKIR